MMVDYNFIKRKATMRITKKVLATSHTKETINSLENVSDKDKKALLVGFIALVLITVLTAISFWLLIK